MSNYCKMLNQVFRVSSGTCQQFVEDAVKISNISGFSTFTRYCSNRKQVRWKFLHVHIENFLTNQLVKEF